MPSLLHSLIMIHQGWAAHNGHAHGLTAHTHTRTPTHLPLSVCPQAVANSEHNPIKRECLASPAAMTRMKIVVAKMVIIVCAVGINVGTACSWQCARGCAGMHQAAL